MIGRHGGGAVLFKNVQIFDGTGADRFPWFCIGPGQSHRASNRR